MLDWIKTIFGQSSTDRQLKKTRRALALVCYYQYAYFSVVLESILQQTINGKPFSEYYDLYIFQDGLQDRHLTANQSDHASVTQLARVSVDDKHFFLQQSNLGIAKHFDFIERYLFESQNYPFVVFCEHDMVLGERYLEELTKLADLCVGDSRIGMISMHSQNRRKSIEEQHAHRHEYDRMGHSWGFGMFRDSWMAIRPVVQEYLMALGDAPYYLRNDVLLVDWLAQKGFKPLASSQDHIKACALTAVNRVRVSLFINLGRYIGAQGEHFTPAQFEQMGFGNDILYNQSLGDIKKLTQNNYQQILAQSSNNLLMPGRAPLSELSPVNIPANILSSKMTQEDAVAAYKFFLGRFPESMEMMRERVGLPCDAVFRSFITSDEFLQRQEYWPSIVNAAQKIVQLHAKLKEEKGSQSPPN